VGLSLDGTFPMNVPFGSENESFLLSHVWNFAKKTMEFVGFFPLWLKSIMEKPYKFHGFLSKVSNPPQSKNGPNLVPEGKKIRVKFLV
jgi:hypothetical protein